MVILASLQGFLGGLLYFVLAFGSVFLILLVMIQRGKGGGLAGALGGMGGYSAFGTRAGDLFTKITLVTAAIWIVCAMALAWINVKNIGKYNNPAAAAPAAALPKGPTAASDDSDAPPAGTPAAAQPAEGRFLDEKGTTQPAERGGETEAP